MPILSLLLLVLVAPPSGPDKTHTARHKTKHFTIRYRPGSRAGAAVDRVAAMVERDLGRICAQLAIEPRGTFVLYLYDDVPELQAINKQDHAGGFSVPGILHVPFLVDQTRYHELVHVVAERLPRTGDEPRTHFHADGLANALLEFVDGVHVHAVAAFAWRRRRLPPLSEMAGAKDFYAWMHAHPGVNAYDIAASWFRFLLDTHGAEKVRTYYGGVPGAKAFGVPLRKLEKDWHEALEAYPLRPEVVTLLRRRAGEPVRFDVYALDVDRRLPKELLGKAKDWKDLTAAKLSPLKAADWSRKDGKIHGRSTTDDWSWCELGASSYSSCVIRTTITPARGCVGVQVRLGERAQAMITNAGTFVWKDSIVAMDRAEPLRAPSAIDLFVVRKGGQLEIWTDGMKIVSGRADEAAARVGLGVAGGSAVFQDVRVRRLK